MKLRTISWRALRPGYIEDNPTARIRPRLRYVLLKSGDGHGDTVQSIVLLWGQDRMSHSSCAGGLMAPDNHRPSAPNPAPRLRWGEIAVADLGTRTLWEVKVKASQKGINARRSTSGTMSHDL
jgi:hypothetical protein